MHAKAKYYIEKLKLLPHPEGGYFKEIYRSGELISTKGLPARYKNKRAFSTSIYFLLYGKQVSKFHKLKSDEVWHFYNGSPVNILILNDETIERTTLGKDLSKGEMFQFTVKKNSWFAAGLVNKSSYALIGCSVSPGFEFDDFQIADRDLLTKRYPHFENEIKKFT